MKQKIKTGMVAAVLLLCIAAVSMRYKWINEKYEKPEIQEYTVNETFVTDGMQVTLTDKNILEYAQLAEKYQISDTQMEQVYQAYPTVFLIAQYHIKNIILKYFPKMPLKQVLLQMEKMPHFLNI